MHSRAPRAVRRAAGLVAVALATTGLAAAASATPGVTPAHVSESLAPGGSVTITKTVETPPIPPNPDIVFLADTTGSMGASITNVRNNAASILNQVRTAQPTAQFAVAEYKDVVDGAGVYQVNQNLTANSAAVVAGIGQWDANGGGDVPEAWIGALGRIPTTIGFRPNGTRVVVMFGDASSHDPSLGFTLASATSGLQAAGIRVIAINVPGGNGLDASGQATHVTSQTGGTLANANPSQVAAEILSQLQNLPAVVTHTSTCDDGVSATLTPASQTVTSGGSVTFEETVALTADAPQGSTVSCEVAFAVNGAVPGPDFVQTVDVAVRDVTPPVVTVGDRTVEATGPDGAVVAYPASAVDNVDGPLTPACMPPSGSTFPLGATTARCEATDAAGNTGHGAGTMTVVDTTAPTSGCEESTNPGSQVPAAGGGKSGQNPDGFYRLVATDVVDADPQVYLRDTGSGHVFGPFDSGQRIKYTQAASGPRSKPMPGGILHLTGTGDGETYATDFSGNSSTPADCLVPARPK